MNSVELLNLFAETELPLVTGLYMPELLFLFRIRAAKLALEYWGESFVDNLESEIQPSESPIVTY